MLFLAGLPVLALILLPGVFLLVVLLRLAILLEWRLAWLRRSESIVDRGEIVVEIVLVALLVEATFAVLALLPLLGGGQEPEIVLGVLVVVLGTDRIAGYSFGTGKF